MKITPSLIFWSNYYEMITINLKSLSIFKFTFWGSYCSIHGCWLKRIIYFDQLIFPLCQKCWVHIQAIKNNSSLKKCSARRFTKFWSNCRIIYALHVFLVKKNIEKVIGIFKRILSNIYDGAFVQKLIIIKSKKASSITCIWESCKYTSKGILLVLEFSIPK